MGLRDAFETEAGLVLATTLHTIGAIAVVAALAMWLSWAKRVHDDQSRDELRRATGKVIWLGIAANLVGGGMRTYLPDHPTIVHIGDEPWVQVMVLKHLFILAALFGLVHLHHVVGPWLEKRKAAGRLDERAPTAQAVSVFLVVLGVVVASVLGGYAQITPIEHEGDDDVVVQSGGDAPTLNATQYLHASGSVTGFGPVDQPATGSFDVPRGTAFLGVSLVWDDPLADLRITLDSTRNDSVEGAFSHGASFGDADGDVSDAIESPVWGPWSYVIEGDNAINVAWTLVLSMQPAEGLVTTLSETLQVAPGAFFEINTVMELEKELCWDWAIAEGEEVHFDVHTHFDGEVQYIVEQRVASGSGCITSQREGGHSLLWEALGTAPVTLTYTVWGEFEVDSYFPPR